MVGIIIFVMVLIELSIYLQQHFQLGNALFPIIVLVIGMVLVSVFGKTSLFKNNSIETQTIEPVPSQSALSSESSDDKLVIQLDRDRVLKRLKGESRFNLKDIKRFSVVLVAALLIIDANFKADSQEKYMVMGVVGLVISIAGILIGLADIKSGKKLLKIYSQSQPPALTLDAKGITCPITILPSSPGMDTVYKHLIKTKKKRL